MLLCQFKEGDFSLPIISSRNPGSIKNVIKANRGSDVLSYKFSIYMRGVSPRSIKRIVAW